MSKFKILATISVEGDGIKTTDDAVDELRVLLGCYDDMVDTDTSINISVKTIQEED